MIRNIHCIEPLWQKYDNKETRRKVAYIIRGRKVPVQRSFQHEWALLFNVYVKFMHIMLRQEIYQQSARLDDQRKNQHKKRLK